MPELYDDDSLDTADNVETEQEFGGCWITPN